MCAIAFLMLCHKDPDQVNLLAKKLSSIPNSEIYIHVDLNNTHMREQIIGDNKIHVLPEDESFFVTWGTISIVEATLSLIRHVEKSKPKYDYLWLISGQDYPICKNDEILRHLDGNDYIEILDPKHPRYNSYKKLYELPYPSWMRANRNCSKIAKRIYMLLTGGFAHTFQPLIMKKPFDGDLSFGSQWWALTSETAYGILRDSDKHPQILNYYKRTIIPDESFFQTMYLRGNYKVCKKHNLTFVNWKGDRRSPDVLTIGDEETLKIKRQEYCFARKFETGISDSLILKIEES